VRDIRILVYYYSVTVIRNEALHLSVAALFVWLMLMLICSELVAGIWFVLREKYY
jgi:Na+-transporting NADH:ubiquinone oxidoreductase subunit NqrC